MFEKGKSGNPSGRPKGTLGNGLRKLIIEATPQILQGLIDQSLAGDVGASKVLLDRVMPVLKSQSLPIDVDQGSSLVESGNNLINSAFSGEVSPDIAAQLIIALSGQAKLIEQTELITRIELLEGKQ